MENMLVTLSTPDENNRSIPSNARHVGEKLVQHYKTVGDVNSVARVLEHRRAFEQDGGGLKRNASSGWLQPISNVMNRRA